MFDLRRAAFCVCRSRAPTSNYVHARRTMHGPRSPSLAHQQRPQRLRGRLPHHIASHTHQHSFPTHNHIDQDGAAGAAGAAEGSGGPADQGQVRRSIDPPPSATPHHDIPATCTHLHQQPHTPNDYIGSTHPPLIQPIHIHIYRASSVLNRNVREFGVARLFDGGHDSCWNSEQVRKRERACVYRCVSKEDGRRCGWRRRPSLLRFPSPPPRPRLDMPTTSIPNTDQHKITTNNQNRARRSGCTCTSGGPSSRNRCSSCSRAASRARWRSLDFNLGLAGGCPCACVRPSAQTQPVHLISLTQKKELEVSVVEAPVPAPTPAPTAVEEGAASAPPPPPLQPKGKGRLAATFYPEDDNSLQMSPHRPRFPLHLHPPSI